MLYEKSLIILNFEGFLLIAKDNHNIKVNDIVIISYFKIRHQN